MSGAPTAANASARTGMGRIVHNSTLYLIGNVAGRLVAFLAIPFYSRFLTPAQYGLIELIELSTQTIALAFGLQAIGTAMTRLYYDQASAEAERDVVSTALIATAVLSAGVTILSVAGAGPISRAVFHTGEWATLLQAAFIAMFFASMTEVVLVYERMRDNARFYLYYSLVTLALSLGLNILFIGGLDAGVWGFVSSKLIVSSGGALFLLWRLRRDVGWHWRGVYVPEFVRFGAPLILSGLSYFAIHFSDRFFLTANVSLTELGRYALAYRFALMVNAIVGDSFAKSWSVSFYRQTAADDWRARFAQVAAYLTLVLCTTGLAIALFGPELLRIMVPPSFFPPALLLPVLVLAYVVRDIADFFRSLLLINKRSVWVGQIALAAAALNLLANAVLIPPFGTEGAAWATLVTWSAYLAVNWAVARREHRLPIRLASYAALFALMITVYAIGTRLRVEGLILQIVLDGVWVVLFVALAAGMFLSREERLIAVRTLGGLLLRILVPAPPQPASPVEPGRHVLLLAGKPPSPSGSGAARPRLPASVFRNLGASVTVVSPAPTRSARSPPRPGQHRSGRLAWLRDACRAGSAAITPATVLVSTPPSGIAHLAAFALKLRTGRPWIASVDDRRSGVRPTRAYCAGQIDAAIERLVLTHADAVLATSDRSAMWLAAQYPAMAYKIGTIRPGLDPADPALPQATALAALLDRLATSGL